SPSNRCTAKRSRQRPAVLLNTPSCPAIPTFVAPSAAANTIRARIASACPVERRRAKDSSSRRSSTLSSIADALPFAIPPSQIRRTESLKLRDQDTRHQKVWDEVRSDVGSGWRLRVNARLAD